MHEILIHLQNETYAGLHESDPIEEQLLKLLDETAMEEFDGNEVGPDGLTLLFYSSDGDAFYEKILPVLENDPVGKFATITIRYEGWGGPEKVLRVAADRKCGNRSGNRSGQPDLF